MNKHHLIPKSQLNHPVLKFLLANGGFDIDHADNLLMLPSESKAAQAAGAALDVDGDANHVGKHSKYTQAVKALLDKLQSENDIDEDGNSNISTERANKLRKYGNKGTLPFNCNFSAITGANLGRAMVWWTACPLDQALLLYQTRD